MNTILSTHRLDELHIVSFAATLPKGMPIRCIKTDNRFIALDKPNSEESTLPVLLHEADKIEAFITLLSALPASKKQLVTTILNMSSEFENLFSVEEMMKAAEKQYGKDFLKQKEVAQTLLSLPKQKKESITRNAISPPFYYSAIEQKTDDIVDALARLADMNTTTLKQLTSWIKDIITRDKITLTDIILELDSALPPATETERKQRATKLKELLFVKRYPHWSQRHEMAENIKKGIRANHKITVEYPPFFEGNSMTIRATISTEKEITDLSSHIEHATDSINKLLKIVRGEEV